MRFRKKWGMRVSSLLTAAAFAVSFLPMTAGAEETGIALNAANFPDGNFRTYLMSSFDQNSDAVLSDDEITAATEIDVTGLGIADLTGISFFVNLSALNCSNNELTALDLSQNLMLGQLACSGNQLETLDVSAHPMLMAVNCNQNQLTALDVSACNFLMVLSCDENRLSSIQLDGCSALTDLSCNGNQFSSLELDALNPLKVLSGEGNTITAEAIADGSGGYYVTLPDTVDLNRVTILSGDAEVDTENGRILLHTPEDFTYQYTVQTAAEHALSVTVQLTYAAEDAVPLTAAYFPDITLRRYLSDNYDTDQDGMLAPDELWNIRSLNFTGMAGLTNLTGVKYLRYLESLQCASLPLTALDLSGLQYLQELNCRSCQLESLTLTGLSALTSLDCGENQLKELALTELTALTDLHCDMNHLTALDVPESLLSGEIYADNNELTISVDVEGVFPLAELPSFDALRIVPDSLTNAAVQDNHLIIANTEEPVTYAYYLYPAEDAPAVYFQLNSEVENLAIDEVHFPDTQFRAIVSAYDTDGDGFFSRGELDAVTELHAADQNIGYLNGISYFRNITELDVSGNNLHGLDVSALTKLTVLNCSSNALSTLLLGNAADLKILDCSNNAPLAALDLSSAEMLQELSCNSCRLSELDLTNAAALSSLDCSWNVLTDLSLPPACLLESLQCNSNKLTALQLQGLPALKQLNCSVNSLEALDVTALPALEQLICASSSLTELDVSACSKLTYLNCSGNQLTALDVSGLTQLTLLDCLSNQLCCLNIPADQQAPQINAKYNLYQADLDTVNRIKLSSLPGGFEKARIVPSSLTNAVIIGNDLYVTDPQQNVTYDYIIYPGEEPITAQFSLKPQAAQGEMLVAIDAENFPDDAFRSAVREYDWDQDEYLSQLEISIVDTLNLGNMGIEDFTGVEYFTSLKTLDCTGNELTTLTVAYLPYLEELNCSGNALSSLHLGGLPSLKKLFCDYNLLTELDVTALSSLEYLSCIGNQLTKLQADNLSKLVYLYCQENALDELSLQNLSGLQYLECSDNQLKALDLSDCIQLKDLQCRRNQLVCLDVSASAYTVAVSAEDNSRTIPVQAISEYDITNIADGFLPERVVADSWTNAVCAENVIRIADLSQSVTYSYSIDENRGLTAAFSLIPELTEENVVPIESDFFPDDAFRSYISSQLDVNRDSYLAASELEAVTDMDVSGLGIKNLQGLSLFSQLEKLDCSDNTLTLLNEFPEHLRSLNCAGNQLSLLRVNSLTELEYLNCDDNALKALDVSALNQLKFLSCRKNKLTELNVLSLSELETLRCGDNALTALDLYRNTKLRYLECARTSLSNLVVSVLSELQYLDCSEIGIDYLYLGKNQLSELDCHGNQLFQLETVFLTKLEHLNCSDNLLTVVDLSALTGLKELHADNNPMYALKLSDAAPIETCTLENCSTTITPKLGTDGALQFDMSSLYHLESDRCSNWVNAKQNGAIITISQPLEEITYQYDTGNRNATAEFILELGQIPIGAAEISLEEHPDFFFSHEYFEPKVIVRVGDTILEENTDYTLSYADNFYAGTARVIVTAAANSGWTGQGETTFEILRGVPIVKPAIEDRSYLEGEKVPKLWLNSGSNYGSIFWSSEDVNRVLEAGENVLEWVFMPADEENFQAVVGTMKIIAETTTTTTTSTTRPTTTSSATTTVTTTETTASNTTAATRTSTVHSATTLSFSSTEASTTRMTTASSTTSTPSSSMSTETTKQTSTSVSSSTAKQTTSYSQTEPTTSDSGTATHSTSASSILTRVTTTFTRPTGVIFTRTTTTMATTTTSRTRPSGVIFTTTTSTTSTTQTKTSTTTSWFTDYHTTASTSTLTSTASTETAVSFTETTETTKTTKTTASTSVTTTESSTNSIATTTTRRRVITTPSTTTDLPGTVTTTVTRKLPTMVGDADMNGKIEMNDAYRVLIYASNRALGNSEYMLYPDDMLINHYLLLLMDVDENGEVNMTDAYWILIYSSYCALGVEKTWDEVIHKK